MNTKQQTIAFLVLVMSMVISGCGPGQLLGPTFTPPPTFTVTPTSTLNSTPTLTPTSTNIPTITPTPLHPLGKIVYHEGLGISGYDYFSYLPRTLSRDKKVYIAIGPQYGQCDTCCDVKGTANNVRYFMNSLLSYADTHDYILLFPVISNNCDGIRDNWVLHFPNYVFTDPVDSPFYRPDLKLNTSIYSLQELLRKDGYNVNEKVFIYGFSIGGLASNRYTLLQPERVQAFAAGGTAGDISMPVDNIQGVKLNWPQGINDFESLDGVPFDRDAYFLVPQFYFLGDNDFENYHLAEICNAGSDVACYWANYWGGNLVAAFRNQCAYLQELGMDVICQEYPGIKHEFTSEMYDDVFDFFDKIRAGN